MQMALDDSLTEEQRLKLAVYEYPLNDHYNKVKYGGVVGTQSASPHNQVIGA